MSQGRWMNIFLVCENQSTIECAGAKYGTHYLCDVTSVRDSYSISNEESPLWLALCLTKWRQTNKHGSDGSSSSSVTVKINMVHRRYSITHNFIRHLVVISIRFNRFISIFTAEHSALCANTMKWVKSCDLHLHLQYRQSENQNELPF